MNDKNENDKKYNPYEDKSIHYTHSNDTQPVTNREGFNDIIKHYDRVNGFQSPKTMEDIPKSLRTIIRLTIAIGVLLGLGTMLYLNFKEILFIFK